jgi:cytochrome c-type biogenesis protein CcmH
VNGRRVALLCATLTLLVVAPASASEQHPTPAELESELVCPVCETTLDTSNAPVALRMKAFIRERIAAGDTKSEIKATLVDPFGPAVLAEPPKKGFELVAWLLPLAGLALGVIVVGLLAWRWSHARGDDEPAGEAEPLDPALEQRLDDELARYEP